VSARVQPAHVPAHAWLQHTPSTQKPLVQSPAPVHAQPAPPGQVDPLELEPVELDEPPPPLELDELLVPQSQAPHAEPFASQVWPPWHAPGPRHA
jgi:hypothetical protein